MNRRSRGFTLVELLAVIALPPCWPDSYHRPCTQRLRGSVIDSDRLQSLTHAPRDDGGICRIKVRNSIFPVLTPIK